MTISTIYRDFLTQDIIKESLKQGKVLTKKEIDAALEEFIAVNPSLSNPFTQRSVYDTEMDEDLSVDKMSNLLLIMNNDLSVVYESLTQQATDVTSTYDSVTSEFKGIEKRIRELEEKVGNLLIVSRDIEGSFDYVSDKFSRKDKIDLENSTVFADNKAGVVTLEPLTHSRIPMPVVSTDMQFNVITRDQLQAITLAPASELSYAFSDQETIWLQRVQMARGVGSVTAEMIVRMPDSTAEVSKMIFKPAVSDAGNLSTVTVQYSDDGLNWFNPTGTTTAPLQGDVTLIFTATKAAYWKFVFNKAGYDQFSGDSYVYEFGAKTIQFYGVQYKTQENKLQGTLVSKVLEAEKEFNKASLKVCESVPDDTNINYYIAALTPTEISDYNAGTIGLADLNFNVIDPIEREEFVNPQFIDFKNLNDLTGVTSDYDKDYTGNFRYTTNYNTLIDYVVPTNIVRSELNVLRNTGDNTANGGANTPVQVKRVDNGWAFDGTYYTCGFYVSEDSGKTIDFGPESAEIDGVVISGKTVLKKGFHKIKTHKNNWRTVSPLDIAASYNPDILYPYNHKYLIEGVGDTLYGDDLTATIGSDTKKSILDPDSVYAGAERYWESTLEEVGPFDFANNIDDDVYEVYSFINDFNGDERIMIKDSLEPGLLTSEKLAIITRTVSSDLHKGIVLKAELSSEDAKATPVLDEYIVRLGF